VLFIAQGGLDSARSLLKFDMCRHLLGKMKEKELNKYAKNMQDKHVNLRVVMKKKVIW
jgi:hypothetical protein